MVPITITRSLLFILLSTAPSFVPTVLALPTATASEPVLNQQQPIFEAPPTHPWSFWLYANPQCNTNHPHPSPLPGNTAADPHAFSTHAGHDNRRCEKINLGVPALAYKTTSGGSGITGAGIAPCRISFYNDANCKDGSQVGNLKLSSDCQQPKRAPAKDKDGKETTGKDEVLAFSVHC